MTRRALGVLLTASVGAGALATALACGESVDLGGTSDASLDAGAADDTSVFVDAAPLAECDPCSTASDCAPSGTCVPVGGHEGFCVTLCPRGLECDNDDSCRTTATITGETVDACVPLVDACVPPPPPPGPDGAPLERWGPLVGPPIAAACHACDKPSECQPNGCYGGWWCNTGTSHCQKPPTTCP